MAKKSTVIDTASKLDSVLGKPLESEFLAMIKPGKALGDCLATLNVLKRMAAGNQDE